MGRLAAVAVTRAGGVLLTSKPALVGGCQLRTASPRPTLQLRLPIGQLDRSGWPKRVASSCISRLEGEGPPGPAADGQPASLVLSVKPFECHPNDVYQDSTLLHATNVLIPRP
jgi:hypothetical protein